MIGDIPYLTEALSCAVHGKAIEPYRALPAMPAPTTLPSRWNARIGIPNQDESSTEDESETERPVPTLISKAGGRWLLDKLDVIMFVYEWRVGYPDPIAEALQEPWVAEYLASCLPVCKVRATMRDGSKVTLCRDWMMPKGLSNPRHSVDFQPTVLDENEWKGKLALSRECGKQWRERPGSIMSDHPRLTARGERNLALLPALRVSLIRSDCVRYTRETSPVGIRAEK